MRLVYALVTLTLLCLAGFAQAGVNGEEAFVLDLTAIPGGKMLYIKCSNGRTLTDCGFASLWEQTNDLPGLQTGVFNYGGRAWERDHHLLG